MEPILCRETKWNKNSKWTLIYSAWPANAKKSGVTDHCNPWAGRGEVCWFLDFLYRFKQEANIAEEKEWREEKFSNPKEEIQQKQDFLCVFLHAYVC